MQSFSAPLLLIEAIGSTAAVCTTASSVPQLMRVWRPKSARDIWLVMFLMLSFGVGCWLVYGISLGPRAHGSHSGHAGLILSLGILVPKFRWAELRGGRINEPLK